MSRGTPWPAAGRSFTWSGRRIAYEEHGRGTRVAVLVHGLMMDRRLYRGLARDLAARGHHVVLVDLLGHGQSDKPRHAAEYRMDVYGDQLVALLDHLGLERAVLGGMSLGANVSLLVAARHPDRVRGLVLEMPVLERAVPAAALTFVPALLAVHYALPAARAVSRIARRLGGERDDLVTAVLAPLAAPPEVTAAVLHGILVGPVAPTVDERRTIEAPALVLGHRADLLHPFSDAEALCRQLRSAELVVARTPLELRLRPARLVACIDGFLGAVADAPRDHAAAGGRRR